MISCSFWSISMLMGQETEMVRRVPQTPPTHLGPARGGCWAGPTPSAHLSILRGVNKVDGSPSMWRGRLGGVGCCGELSEDGERLPPSLASGSCKAGELKARAGKELASSWPPRTWCSRLLSGIPLARLEQCPALLPKASFPAPWGTFRVLPPALLT